MKAMVYQEFGARPEIRVVDDPIPPDGGVVIKVEATGLCRSDWHGWMGHDPDITLPHVPGHELAGVVEAAGKEVTRWQAGDRVTVRSLRREATVVEARADGRVQVQVGTLRSWVKLDDLVLAGRSDGLRGRARSGRRSLGGRGRRRRSLGCRCRHGYRFRRRGGCRGLHRRGPGLADLPQRRPDPESAPQNRRPGRLSPLQGHPADQPGRATALVRIP